MRRLSASSSSTQGPAIRKNASSGNEGSTSVYGLHQLAGASLRLGRTPSPVCRRDESGKERMGPSGPGLQLGMELAADEPGMGCQLHDFNQLSVGAESTQLEAPLNEQVAVRV